MGLAVFSRLQTFINKAAALPEIIKRVMTRSIVHIHSELCFPFLKEVNSAFITAIASGLFPQTEYRSLE